MTWGFWRERCSVFFLFLTLVSAQFKPAMNKSKYWRGVSLSKRSLVTSGFLKTIFRTFWATACLDICSSNGCWDKLTGSLSSSDLVDTSLIRLIKGPLSRSAGKQGQQHHWIRAGKSLWSCQFFPMNKRLGWDHIGSSLTTTLGGFWVFLAWLSVFVFGNLVGSVLWSLLSWITAMAVPIQAGTAVALGAPPGAPHRGKDETLEREAGKRTNKRSILQQGTPGGSFPEGRWEH